MARTGAEKLFVLVSSFQPFLRWLWLLNWPQDRPQPLWSAGMPPLTVATPSSCVAHVPIRAPPVVARVADIWHTRLLTLAPPHLMRSLPDSNLRDVQRLRSTHRPIRCLAP